MLDFTCPRCGVDVAENFYGPCTACRGALRNMLIVRVQGIKGGKPTDGAFAYRVDGEGPATHWPCGGEITSALDVATCAICGSQGDLTAVTGVKPVAYEPKMNVVPNQVAMKENG